MKSLHHATTRASPGGLETVSCLRTGMKSPDIQKPRYDFPSMTLSGLDTNVCRSCVESKNGHVLGSPQKAVLGSLKPHQCPLSQPVGVLCTWSTTFCNQETRISSCLDERMPPLPWRVMGFMMASFIVGCASRPCPLAQWPLAVEGVGSLCQPQDLPLIRRHISPYNS